MALKEQISYQITLVLLLLVCLRTEGLRNIGTKEGKTWCVAQVSAPGDKLQEFIDFACSKMDCSPIKEGGACYNPNTVQNHGSWALDAYYQANGECDPAIGTPAVTDPSFGDCHYP